MGAYTKIVDFTLPSNTNFLEINDFGTITKDDFVKVVTTFSNPSNFIQSINLFANTDTTAANYHRQLLLGNGTSVSAERQNSSRFNDNLIQGTSTTVVYIKLSENDRFNYFSNNTKSDNSNIQLVLSYVTSSGATFANGITSLTFTSGRNMKAGSRIQIYKLDAEKLADITVESNTTQVDILKLSIDKDSEYLLISDIKAGASTDGSYFLTVNDLTTQSGYHNQRILGNGSTASAVRENNAKYCTNSNLQGLVYSHIKLSNIGAYTSQNYGLRDYGTTEPLLENRFLSSTSEAITSITKLNIIGGTNGIGAASRFILYKLY